MIIKDDELKNKTTVEIVNKIKEIVDGYKKNSSNIILYIPKKYVNIANHLNQIKFEGFVSVNLMTDTKNNDIHIEELEKNNYVIAIDGPSASGKSTIAKELSKILSISYLDTGAMYRAVTFYLLSNGIELNEEEIKKVLDNIQIDIIKEKVLLNNKDISKQIRGEKVTENVSLVSSFAIVREKLINLQREIAQGKSIILDGRDIGTVVFPDAKYKFFITATAEQRALRRFKDEKSSINKSYNEILKDIKIRDEKDMNRKISPLIKAKDAYLIDSTNLNINKVIEKILTIMRGINV